MKGRKFNYLEWTIDIYVIGMSLKKKSRINIGIFINMAKNDFQSRYASSFLGVVWAYVQPLINLLVMWYVFQVGLRSSNVKDVPFIVWFAPASLVWSFFADSLSSTTMCMKEYNYLVCKVNFDIKMIPVIKIMSSCLVHIVFIFFLYFLNSIYKVPFSLYSIQVWYYFICLIVYLVGIGMIVSVVTPFLPDLQSIINVVLQIGFWATPIVWNIDAMSPMVQKLCKLNPVYYIVTGYRDSLIDHIWFWERKGTTLYFWGLTLLILVGGYRLFKKMKKHLADVL